MEYKLYHLTFSYDDLTTIAEALDFKLNNIEFNGDELEECPVEDFLNKVKNEELEQTGWKPQTTLDIGLSNAINDYLQKQLVKKS